MDSFGQKIIREQRRPTMFKFAWVCLRIGFEEVSPGDLHPVHSPGVDQCKQIRNISLFDWFIHSCIPLEDTALQAVLFLFAAFPTERKRADFAEPRHRDFLKMRAEPIEPTSDADGCDRDIMKRSVIDSFEPGIPQGDSSRRECSFASHSPRNECGQMKADCLVRLKILVKG